MQVKTDATGENAKAINPFDGNYSPEQYDEWEIAHLPLPLTEKQEPNALVECEVVWQYRDYQDKEGWREVKDDEDRESFYNVQKRQAYKVITPIKEEEPNGLHINNGSKNTDVSLDFIDTTVDGITPLPKIEDVETVEHFDAELVATEYATQYPEKDYHDLQHAVIYGIKAYAKHFAKVKSHAQFDNCRQAAAADSKQPWVSELDISETIIYDTFVRGAQWQQSNSQQQRDRWISIEDRLPENMESVILYSPEDGRFVGHIEIYENHSVKYEWATNDYNYNLNHVTHWQPLPKSPAK